MTRAGARAAVVIGACIALALTVCAPAANALRSVAGAGELLNYQRVDDPDFAMPGAGTVYSVQYNSRGADGRLTPVRGTVWFPTAAAPATGYPVVAAGHGTSGLGDECTLPRAFASAGPSYGPYYGPWLKQGFVLVAPEYAGIGGPGVHPYLDRRVAGANMIDAVRAARQLGDRVGVDVDGRFATTGGSQGGHASLSAGDVAAEYAPELTLLGTTAVAPPVYIDRYLSLLGPHIPAVPVPDYVTYLSYVLRGLQASRPGLDVNAYLTPVGRTMLRAAETLCYPDMVARSRGLGVGDILAEPLHSGPLMAAVRDVQVIPASGFTRPILIHQGIADVTAFSPLTDQFVADVRAAGTRVDYRTSMAGHGVGPQAEVQSAQWARSLWRADVG